MSKNFKIVLILLIAASVISAVMAVFSFVGKEREYMKRLLLEDKLSAILKDKKGLEDQIDSSKKAKEEAESKIKKIQEDMADLKALVKDEKEKNKDMSLDISEKEEKIERLKKDLEIEKKEKLTISKKLEDMEFDYTKAKTDASRLKQEKERLEKRLFDLKERSVDLDTIVVNPASYSATTKSAEPVKELMRGRVLVVNREYGFIVIDLGKNDGVEKGIAFEVKDVRDSLGRVEIDKVYDTMSSATVLPGGDVGRMKKGDLVIESR
ncbi:MAG: hypothetical protein KKH08_07635 [Candidatus Omnitrophica bacterium]|nr:hypothetical protein [Candidatus Omnitrophota bacterium]